MKELFSHGNLETRTQQSQSQSHIATDGQSVCLSWCRAPSGPHDQILVTVLCIGGGGALSDVIMLFMPYF
jgi:hypothetical protein